MLYRMVTLIKQKRKNNSTLLKQIIVYPVPKLNVLKRMDILIVIHINSHNQSTNWSTKISSDISASTSNRCIFIFLNYNKHPGGQSWRRGTKCDCKIDWFCHSARNAFRTRRKVGIGMS